MKHAAVLQREVISLVPLPSWIRAAVRCGFAIAPVLQDIGIPVVDRGEQGIVITQDQSFRLMQACVARAQREHFPFVLGENCVLGGLPEITAYVCSCATLRDAITSYNWVRDLMSNGVNLTLNEMPTHSRIRIDIGQARSRSPSAIFLTEALMASVVKLISQLVGSKEIERLTLRHMPPDYAPEYDRYFGLPVRFDHAEDAVVIRTELLDRALNGAVPELHQHAKAQILRRVAKLTSLASMTGQLSRLFADRPDLLACGLEAAAAQLQMHPRTLQRRLHEEQQTFADVQTQSQFALTCSLLRNTDCSVNEISEQLGFSDRRAFTRAFKRWSSVSPSGYRIGGAEPDRHAKPSPGRRLGQQAP